MHTMGGSKCRSRSTLVEKSVGGADSLPANRLSRCTALLSSIIWREFCSSPLLAGTLQCFCVREESGELDLGSAHREQSSKSTNRVFGNMRDWSVPGNRSPDAK